MSDANCLMLYCVSFTDGSQVKSSPLPAGSQQRGSFPRGPCLDVDAGRPFPPSTLSLLLLAVASVSMLCHPCSDRSVDGYKPSMVYSTTVCSPMR